MSDNFRPFLLFGLEVLHMLSATFYTTISVCFNFRLTFGRTLLLNLSICLYYNVTPHHALNMYAKKKLEN